MDNGVRVVDDSDMLESKNVEGTVAYEKSAERVIAGSDETLDVEDEVFEEPSEIPEHLQEPAEDCKLHDGGLVADATVNGDTFDDTGSVEVQENSNLESEAEIFEEAIEVPTDVEPQGDVAVDKQEVGDLSSGEHISGSLVSDKIDERGTEMEAQTDELNGGMEVPKINGTGKTEISRDIDEGNPNSDTAIENPVKGGANKVNLEGTLADENLETSEGDKEDDLLVKSELEDTPATDYQADKVAESADTSAAPVVKLQDDEVVEALNDKSVNVDTGTGELSGGKEVPKIGYTGEKEVMKDEDEGNLESDTATEKAINGDADTIHLEATFTDKASETLEVDTVQEDVQTSAGMIANIQYDEINEALNNKSDNVDTGDPRKESTQVIVSAAHIDSVDGKDESDKANKVPASVEVEDNRHGEMKDSSVVRDVKNNGEISELKDSQSEPSVSVEKIAEESLSSAIAEESRKKAGTDDELKQNLPKVGEREILPAPQPSSSAKSTNSATLPSRPAGLGRAAPLLEPAPRVVQQPRANGTVSQAQAQQIEEPSNGEAEDNDETREKLQLIRVKFLRLAHRLGQTPHNVVVAQVLYRLGLAEQLRGGNGGRVGAFSFDRASAMAEQLEAAGNEPLDFSCTIMVLGKSGVGKSSTINSIFDEVKFRTDAFQTGTKKVQDIVGTVHGIKVRVIDTPGLLSSWSDQRQNEKILQSVKNFIKKTPPDIVLYLDRLDMQTRDFGDMPLLRTISEIFGPSIWFNAIVVLTHAASAPPDGPNGTASSYDMFVTQRSHVVQQAIRQAVGDMRLMNPVSLVENHSACRTNRAGQRVLPNGQVWKPHLLLLSFASKILAEANSLLKLQDTPPGKPFATRTRTPPLPFLLSSLLQSKPEVKLPEEQYGDDDGIDDDLDESSDSEDESEYDNLPPFKRLTKAQIAKLSKVQKKAYFDELEYREKLFMKKQLKEEKRQRKMMKKMAAAAKDMPSEYGENAEESSGAASVPVPMPDLALPASFDSDNPTHRYRYLDSSNPWLVRPVLDSHGWDHDVGYEGINVERLFVAKEKLPISFSGQITKDKKDANVQMELSSSLKHGEGKATSLGFDMQTIGKDLAYTLRGETRFCNFRKNKATAGMSVTLLGDALSAGLKAEDKLIANKRFQVVMTAGAMTARGDIAYGGSLEAQLKDKDYPLGRSLSTLGLSIMDWHGDLAIGCNLQSQIPVGRSTNLIARANLNNRGAGQVSLRINSSEQLQIALVSLLPLLKKLLDYPRQTQ